MAKRRQLQGTHNEAFRIVTSQETDNIDWIAVRLLDKAYTNAQTILSHRARIEQIMPSGFLGDRYEAGRLEAQIEIIETTNADICMALDAEHPIPPEYEATWTNWLEAFVATESEIDLLRECLEEHDFQLQKKRIETVDVAIGSEQGGGK